MTSPTKHAAAVDVEILRELAKLASPGPWEVSLPDKDDAPVFSVRHHGQEYGTVADCYNFSDGQDQRNAEFIAMTDPVTILALLDQLAASEKRAGEYRKAILKFLAMEHEGYLMVDDATRAAWIEEAKALADPQHGGGGK